MDVLTAAWTAAGAPRTATPDRRDRCARCSSADVPISACTTAVSKVFTGYDGWAHLAGTGLCDACTWAYRMPQLRRAIHLVTAQPPQLTVLPSLAAADLLRQGALSADVCLIVPLRPNRKHLIPAASWARVTVDDANLDWTAADAERLRILDRLRAAGFTARQLAAPAPAWPIMRTAPASQRVAVIADWEALRPWRDSTLWLDLALAVTSTSTTLEVRAS
jgi:hypothetical protein